MRQALQSNRERWMDETVGSHGVTECRDELGNWRTLGGGIKLFRAKIELFRAKIDLSRAK